MYANNHVDPKSMHQLWFLKIGAFLFSKDQLIIHTVGGSNQANALKLIVHFVRCINKAIEAEEGWGPELVTA